MRAASLLSHWEECQVRGALGAHTPERAILVTGRGILLAYRPLASNWGTRRLGRTLSVGNLSLGAWDATVCYTQKSILKHATPHITQAHHKGG